MKLSIYFLLVFAVTLNGQSILERYSAYGEMFIPKFSSAPFPHPDRANGRIYKGTTYPASAHYSDSSVAVFIPKGFEPKKKIDLVIYFHGWYNNIDSACAQFALIEQFCEAKKNAVFVFPEGPKDSPDSFGGRVEGTDGLKDLVADVLRYLKASGKISSGTVGNIVLAGHSGAFRVMAYALMRGGLTNNISDVILFDALYGDTEKFTHWIENSKGRFVNIYTDDGGTKNESENLMADLTGWGIPFFSKEEKEVSLDDLYKNRLIFIHSALTHNEVLAVNRQFRDYLLTSRLQSLQ
jgi:hypothetical protein